MPIHLSPENLNRFAQAKRRVESLHGRLSDIPFPPTAGSALDIDELETPRLVHPAQSAAIMMRNVSNCLVGAMHLFNPSNASGVSPIEILLRTVLVGSCRTTYMLAPTDSVKRQRNALSIAHSDFHSGTRAWKIMGNFEHIVENGNDARARFVEWRNEFPSGRPLGEEAMINEMLAVVESHLTEPQDKSYLREVFLLIWHGYSAVAHANTWQNSLSYMENDVSTTATTGSLVHHFVTLTDVADFSISLLDSRSRV